MGLHPDSHRDPSTGNTIFLFMLDISDSTGLYEYNIQNWPTHIKNGDFEEFLYYNNNPGGLANFTPCYNGNIAASTWIYKGANQGYCYS
jgi:hypothetical protein